MKTKTLKQIGISVSGDAVLSLWGGGSGLIAMDTYFLPNEKISKDNILRCVNDGGFGCESIESAEIEIRIRYENGYEEFDRWLFPSEIHSHLFLGWAELKRQGIKV